MRRPRLWDESERSTPASLCVSCWVTATPKSLNLVVNASTVQNGANLVLAMAQLGRYRRTSVRCAMSENVSIRSTLIEIGAIDDRRVERFAERTRDRDIPVWHDPNTGVIFIVGFYVGDAEYESGQYGEASSFESYEDPNDTARRVSHFRPLYAGRAVLDFGCGDGSFLLAIKTVAGDVQGVELQDSFRDSLNNDGVDCFFDLADCSTPDIAFMFHVLEHLPDPLPTLSALHGMTATSGGTLVVEVPHARDFLIAHAKNQPFINFTLWPQHLVLHTRQSLELLLRAAGYTSIHIYGVQRYGLANHFRWLIDGLPGGHKSPLVALETPPLENAYEAALARMDATDTLIAIAQ